MTAKIPDRPSAGLAAPWYIHPAEQPQAWRHLMRGRGIAFAVVNASNGPAPEDPYYRDALSTTFNTPLAGYVDTAYGARPPAQILKDAQTWLGLSSVRGIMLDCVPPHPVEAPWTLEMIEVLRGMGSQYVVVNPGVPPAPELVMAADVTCVSETSWAEFKRLRLPARLRSCRAEKMWILVHDVPKREQPGALRRISDLGVGFGWVTSGRLPNPWATLPAQW